MCNSDGKNLSHIRFDNFPAALRVGSILYYMIYIKVHQFHFIISKSLLMCIFTHTNENNLNAV